MRSKIKYVLLVLTLAMVTDTFAYYKPIPKSNGDGDGNGKPSNNGNFDAKANCSPATATMSMEFNNIRAVLNTNGLLFRDFHNNGNAGYEAPKTVNGNGPKAIYAAALWMGGTDVNNQLKLAATTFGEGNDFWTGPLSVSLGSGNYDPINPVGDDARRDFGEASIEPEQCEKYDKFFTISKAEVIQFSSWWEENNGVTEPGAEPIAEPSAKTMDRILNWPAHGDPSLGQDHYLAPFYDRPGLNETVGNGIYNPMEEGDYPWYDDIMGRDDIECGVDRRISLFGDETHWWVFNDKGNIHTSSKGDPIGMEIRAQAFAFTTSDEINDMTFYNYEMINRGTQTLYNTYFSQYVDPDLGGAFDDFVGCDVSRGLGYAYNGKSYDNDYQGNPGYGANPPAIGFDFFEGPYQDADGKDNVGPHIDTATNLLVVPTVAEAIADKGIVYSGIGIGYSDGKIDNERFGMRRFSYYINGGADGQSDPSTASQFYNYMKGSWRYGDDMIYGGNGFGVGIHADYMFPNNSDPLNWSTGGVTPAFENWSETNTDGAGTSNQPGDRRFVQSAGPFTLEPGAINNITVGIVYARSNEGDMLASVRKLLVADTKAQALFDNCFEILDPPNAPKLTIQELDQELVLMLTNPSNSNNYKEKYIQEDKINIVDPPVTPGDTLPPVIYDKFYRFEGYQIYQLKDETVSASNIRDISKARLVAECDLKNNFTRLFNYELNEEWGVPIGDLMVDGENKGIRHSFKVTEDLFAHDVKTLVNHKKYYYIAVAYAVNEYKKYNPLDPTSFDGQKKPYIVSRITAEGQSIPSITAIPHKSQPMANGTQVNSFYGDMPEITVIDGHGNGGMRVELNDASLSTVLKSGSISEPTYKRGAGPLNVKIVDPLNAADGYYELKFTDYTLPNNYKPYIYNYAATDTASWVMYRYANKGGALIDSITSDATIQVGNEQIVPEWGISVFVNQEKYTFSQSDNLAANADLNSVQNTKLRTTDVVSASMVFADSTKQWLTGIPDDNRFFPTNWVLSGPIKKGDDGAPDADYTGVEYLNPNFYKAIAGDADNVFSNILGGIIAPQCFVGNRNGFSPIAEPAGVSLTTVRTNSRPNRIPSIQLVITKDKSKWTRAAVFELNRIKNFSVGQQDPGKLRKSPSVDKNGKSLNDGTYGLGWFPGYAIDLETGMRLNIGFGENSFLGSDGGSDMIWNPSSRVIDDQGRPIMGGMQPVYVFGYNINESGCPAYTEGSTWVYDNMMGANAGVRNVYQSIAWIYNALSVKGYDYLASDVTITVNINKQYNQFVRSNRNNGKPMFGFTLDGYAPIVNDANVMAEALDLINVVPNPYYAYSAYESGRLDTRVKIINLPTKCDVHIYNIKGQLIKSFKKDSPITSIEWDLKNSKGTPIASGVYLIHVDVPGVGEKIVKFFGGMRQPDMENI